MVEQWKGDKVFISFCGLKVENLCISVTLFLCVRDISLRLYVYICNWIPYQVRDDNVIVCL